MSRLPQALIEHHRRRPLALTKSQPHRTSWAAAHARQALGIAEELERAPRDSEGRDGHAQGLRAAGARRARAIGTGAPGHLARRARCPHRARRLRDLRPRRRRTHRRRASRGPCRRGHRDRGARPDGRRDRDRRRRDRGQPRDPLAGTFEKDRRVKLPRRVRVRADLSRRWVEAFGSPSPTKASGCEFPGYLETVVVGQLPDRRSA